MRNFRAIGLVQKEKVHIKCEKGAQISILANKKLCITFIFLFSCYFVHIMLLIGSRKLELCLMIVSVLLRLNLGIPNYC